MSEEEYQIEEGKNIEDNESSIESSDSSRGTKDVRRRKGPEFSKKSKAINKT